MKTHILLIFIFLLMSSCAPKRINLPPSDIPLSLEHGVTSLTRYFLAEAEQSQDWLDKQETVAIQQFRYDATNTVPKVYSQIESLIISASKSYMPQLKVVPLSSEVSKTDYLITGWISDKQRNTTNPDAKKFYYLEASILDLDTGKIIANSDVWLTTDDLDVAPIAELSVSSQNDAQAQKQKELAASPAGTQVDISESDLTACKHIGDGNKYLSEGHYSDALYSYTQALQDPRGQRLEVYNNLYSIYKQARDREKMEETFAQMILLSIEKNKTIDVSFLFEPGGAEFLKKHNGEYSMWLQQIGLFFKQNPNYCFNIIGHTSCTGSVAYNCPLSLQRARSIKSYLYKYLSRRVIRQIIGKASKDALVCSKIDENKGTPDRRVEIELVECSLPQRILKDCVDDKLQM